MYIADRGNSRIRKVAAATGIISTVAGDGSAAYAGDGGLATAASLNYPLGVTVDGSGNLYIADAQNNRVRKVDAATGIITTVAGNGVGGTPVEGVAANTTLLTFPDGVAVDSAGNLYIAAHGNFRTYRVDAGGTITTFAGSLPGDAGDGGAATAARLLGPYGVTLGAAGAVFIADYGANRIRRVYPAPATHFSISVPPTVMAGAAVNVTVTALDLADETVTGYTGTVHLTSSDGAALLPPDAVLTSGTGTLSVTFKTAGTQAVTATDTVDAAITGTHASVTVSPAAAARLTVSAPASATAGTAVNATVTALDAFDNVATSYAGTVNFTSSDGVAGLPTDSTLTSGTGIFPVTFKTLGKQTVTATDTATSATTGTSDTVTVSAAGVPLLAPWAIGVVGIGLAGLGSGRLRRRAA